MRIHQNGDYDIDHTYLDHGYTTISYLDIEIKATAKMTHWQQLQSTTSAS
jgi:hypothetical protein